MYRICTDVLNKGYKIYIHAFFAELGPVFKRVDLLLRKFLQVIKVVDRVLFQNVFSFFAFFVLDVQHVLQYN